MDSNDPPMTAASPEPEEDSQNFPKIQENRDFVDQARVSNYVVSRIYEFTNFLLWMKRWFQEYFVALNLRDWMLLFTLSLKE